MTRMYYWKDGQVLTSEAFGFMPKTARGCFCIDLNVPSGASGRIGQWGPDVWTSLPAEDLPPDFRAHLLIMGVPT